MNFWQTLAIATIPALIGALLSLLVSIKQNKNNLKQIEKQVESNLVEYKSKELLEIKKTAIFDSLSLMDLYISWLTIDSGKEEVARNETTILELTERGRKCLNDLCLTCDSKELIEIFLEMFFKTERNIFDVYSDYRKAARKELGLNDIEFDSNRVFIARLATTDLRNNK